MFVYNITFKVDHESLDDWMQWQKTVQIPDILATGCFYDHHFYELMNLEENDGSTFVIQFLAKSKSDYNRYQQIYAAGLRHRAIKKWQDHVVSFRTLLKNVE
jgi:hypothetical protein